jgi:hypothetical protein
VRWLKRHPDVLREARLALSPEIPR